MSRTIGFTAQDAARVRFGRSCLWETVASIRVLRNPAGHGVHRPWIRRVRPELDRLLARVPEPVGAAFALLGELVGSGAQGHYMPDLLTPPPTSLEPALAAELERLAGTPPEVVRAQLTYLRDRWSPRLQAMADDPGTWLARVAEAVAAYWEVALAPSWSRVSALADAEVFHRSRQQAAEGTSSLLNDLHERVVWDGRQLTVSGTRCLGAHDLEGGGLCLVPSVFVWPTVLVIADEQTAQLAFPCRGVGTLWADQDPPAAGALEEVIGRSKARLLAALQAPLSTTEAAARVELSVSTASEHLTALRAAGLVRTHRTGRRTLHVRTAAADTLIAANP
ncbi:helix-turn-helix domain-containing protein [Microlunatus sp. GCM10028923]|uniref:helix-turn-helix domain-containing protein n=1 Tax=Microlunatus sp. GCM10028923 TaxID=3273400 RepID=UPI00360A1586